MPSNLRVGWTGTDSNNPDTYVLSCYSSSVPDCITNAASKDLPMFQYNLITGVTSCITGNGKTASADNICSQMNVSHEQDAWEYHYYYISEDFAEL